MALSGGVDSSVATALLQDEVVACLHMTNWNPNDTEDRSTHHHPRGGGDDDSHDSSFSPTTTTSAGCSGESDWADAQATAHQLGLSVHRVQFQADYWHHVFEPFLQDLQSGLMPNPDIGCNRYLKFGALSQYVFAKYGNDALLATGHYARLWHRGGSGASNTTGHAQPPACLIPTFEQHPHFADWLMQPSSLDDHHHNDDETILLQAADPTKDQSYFLAGCSSSQFRNVLFPLGDYCKGSNQDWKQQSHLPPSSATTPTTTTTVRQLASQHQLPTARKRDSTGICAVGKLRQFRNFVYDFLPPSDRPATFVDIETGNVVGNEWNAHACLYAIGQGAKISGSACRYFVVDTDPSTNTVQVCAGTRHPALYASSMDIHLHWIVPRFEELVDDPAMGDVGTLRVQCRIRHLQPLQNATLIRTENTPGGWRLELDEAVRAVAPGQMAVLYLGLVCLGGGPIVRRGPTDFERLRRDIPKGSSQTDSPAPHMRMSAA